jgi:hypothetical protein
MWKHIEKSFIKLVYYNTKNMITNILTEGFFANKHEYFQHLMGMVKCIT